MLRLTTFGGLGLTHDGTPVADAVAQRRRLLVLAILASEYPTAVSRTRLSGLVWGADPHGEDDSARNNLRQAVFALRQGFAALGAPSSPVVGAAELTLDPRAVATDCIEFSTAIERDDHHTALRVYRGGFLDGVALEQSPSALAEWVALRRERYASQFRSACVSLATDARSRGTWGEVLEAWTALRAYAPDDEEAIRGTLTALVNLGRVDDARQQAVRYDARVGAAAGTIAELRDRAGPAMSFLASLLGELGAPAASTPTPVEPPATSSALQDTSLRPTRPAAAQIANHAAPQRFGRSRMLSTTGHIAAVVAIFLVAVVAFVGIGRMRTSPNYGSSAAPLRGVSSEAVTGGPSPSIALPPITAGTTPALQAFASVLRRALTSRLAANFPAAQLTDAASAPGGTTIRLALDPGRDSVRVTAIIENRAGKAARVASLTPFSVPTAATPATVDSIARAVTVATSFLRQPPDGAEPITAVPRELSAYADYVNARDSYLRTDYRMYAGRLLASYERDSSVVLPAAMAALALSQDGHCDSASRILTRIREHAQTVSERGLVDDVDFLNRGDYTDAEPPILRAYRAQPSAYYWARALSAATKLDDKVHIDSLLAEAPSPWEPGVVTVTTASEAVNRPAFATNYLRTLRTNRPPGAILLTMAGITFAAAGKPDSSLAMLDALAAAETRPDFPQGELMRFIGAELLARGYHVAAARAFHRTVKWYESQSSSEMAPAIRLQYAYALLDDGAVERAMRLLDEVPDALLTRWQQEARHGVLGIAYTRLHDNARARDEDEWLRRQTNTCNFGIAFMWRARIAAAGGNADAAAELLSDAYGAGWPRWITAGPWEETHAMPEFVAVEHNPRFAAVLRGP